MRFTVALHFATGSPVELLSTVQGEQQRPLTFVLEKVN